MEAHGPSLPPDDVVAEILARLPPRSIGRSRAVCRARNAIASHPSVDRVLANRPAAVTAIMKSSGSRWLEVVDGHSPVDVIRFDRFRGRWHPEVHKTEPSPRALSLDDMTISAEVFRSWDGVLCTRVFPRKPPQLGAGADYMLWNPLTGAWPSPDHRGYAHPVTGRFHLLHSSDMAVPGDPDLVSPTTARILAVGDGTGWREVPLPMSKNISSMKSEGDRSVRLRGNLNWPVQLGSGKAALLVFDTAREKFRIMAAPERPGLDPTTARSRVVPGGKLCVLALTKQPPVALEVCGWRFRETVRVDGIRVSPRMFAAAAAVEVVEGVHEGEEIFVQLEDGIMAYSIRSKMWRKVSVNWCCAALLMYRESVMRPEISFGKALRGFRC
uniref:F-box domain-containing protein n=1 Tax=Setaria italica TaxID=4555 RepID=K4AM09_SETIT